MKLTTISLGALMLAGCHGPDPSSRAARAAQAAQATAAEAAGTAGTAGTKRPAPAVRADARFPDHIQTTVEHGDGWLGRYVSSWRGFRTNTYWIEGPDGLILVDTQFLPSAVVEAADLAEAITGKRVEAAIVLHANPDKFNGTAALQARGVRVLTSAQVLALIPAVHELRHGWFYDRFKPDYPDQAAAPESFGDGTRELELAGVTVKLHALGAGCSEAHVVLEHRGHVFVGDLVAGMGHAWLELGKLDEWQRRLDEIAALSPEKVHPGRGPSGGPELLARQKAYLQRVMDHVKAEQAGVLADGEPAADAVDAALGRVASRLFADHPGYPFERFVEIGLPAVWDRVAADR